MKNPRLEDIYNTLISKRVKNNRIIMSISVFDKLINHYYSKTVLESKLSKYLDIRNTATRKNMGSSYAHKLIIII